MHAFQKLCLISNCTSSKCILNYSDKGICKNYKQLLDWKILGKCVLKYKIFGTKGGVFGKTILIKNLYFIIVVF